MPNLSEDERRLVKIALFMYYSHHARKANRESEDTSFIGQERHASRKTYLQEIERVIKKV